MSAEFGKELLVLSSPGIASILTFRKHDVSILKVEDVDENQVDISNIAKCIRREVQEIATNRHQYEKSIDKFKAMQDVSDTLRTLLSQVSKDLSGDHLPAILIGNIITGIVLKRPTNLLIALGLLIRDKKVIEHLHDYRVVCSYDEIKRFKTPAALHNSEKNDCVQAVAKNDAWLKLRSVINPRKKSVYPTLTTTDEHTNVTKHTTTEQKLDAFADQLTKTFANDVDTTNYDDN